MEEEDEGGGTCEKNKYVCTHEILDVDSDSDDDDVDDDDTMPTSYA